MAAAILSIGMMLIATMFPVGIYLTTVAAERTMAAIIADEAFAKIQIYGIVDIHNDPLNSYDYENELGPTKIDPCEFSYNPAMAANPQYYWSAVYRKLAEPNYQITVFIARKTNPNLTYPYPPNPSVDRPRLIEMPVDISAKGAIELTVHNAGEEKYVNPPATVLDNATGKLYRVIGRQNSTVKLDRGWETDPLSQDYIWLIPPPDTGGRNAGIEVYQRIMRF